MERRPIPDTGSLLAHAGWMRALALSLLRDPSAADDVVQDATVAALARAPIGEAELARWLTRVVRNFAFRRRRGERRHAGPHGGFRVDGLAPGSWQVLAVEKEIDSQSTTYSSVPPDAPPIVWSCAVVAGKTTRFDVDLARK